MYPMCRMQKYVWTNIDRILSKIQSQGLGSCRIFATGAMENLSSSGMAYDD